jgi:hypothetical protein
MIRFFAFLWNETIQTVTGIVAVGKPDWFILQCIFKKIDSKEHNNILK